MASPAGAQIRALAQELPPHYAERDAVLDVLKKIWIENGRHGAANLARLSTLHRATSVEGRYFALPLRHFEAKSSFTERNLRWLEAALQIGERAITNALADAGLEARDIDHLFFVTVTGIATPSLDARLVNRLGLRPDVKRTPIFGLGCVAGAAGVARAADYLRAFPHHVALLLSVELCSLTFQRDDVSIANAIATGLFGDGGAAVILTGAARSEATGPRILATRSIFYPETEYVMGWQIGEEGFRIVLSGDVPRLAREHIGQDIDAFLSSHGLYRSDIAHWIAHTGGPKVLAAFQEALDLPQGALSRSSDSLRRLGNLSSASVLFVLGDLLAEGAAKKGDYGVMFAMGPGFCAELVLLQW
jgi:alkylresorcinol/alkylpyrone synthase